MSAHTEVAAWPRADAGVSPRDVLPEAAAALAQACASMLGVALAEEGTGSEPHPDRAACGALISCTHADGGWSINVSGDAPSCARVAQLMFGDDVPAGEPEIGDALGELANVTSGILKTKRAARGQVIQIGLPVVQAGAGAGRFIGRDIRTSVALLGGEGLRLQLVLVYREQ